MSCAKAVITSARATLADYFTADEHGLVVTPESAAELREAIMLLWNEPLKAKTLGEAGQRQISDKFTMEIFSQKLAKIFHEVAAR